MILLLNKNFFHPWKIFAKFGLEVSIVDEGLPIYTRLGVHSSQTGRECILTSLIPLFFKEGLSCVARHFEKTLKKKLRTLKNIFKVRKIWDQINAFKKNQSALNFGPS